MRTLLLALVVLMVIPATAQQPAETAPPAVLKLEQSAAARPGTIAVPAGTKIMVALKHAISTKSARPGDAVYAETTFPIALNDRIIIPPGSYVQGSITSIKRPGRIKGRAEVLFHFTSLIFPSGYTVLLPGALDQLPGAERQRIKDDEGTLQQEGDKGKDAKTIGEGAATGAVIGAAAGRNLKGAGIGGGLGAATGLAITLLTRGSDLRIEQGTALEMVLQRPILLDESRARR